MISAVIVEDEIKASELLKRYAEKYCEVNVIGEAPDVDEAERIIKACKPDIVLLDISLPLYNGFELLERLKPFDFEVIFVTAYDQYAIQAIKLSAVDYLLKPVSINELKTAIQNAKSRIAEKRKNRNLEVLLENLNSGNQSCKIAILDGSSYIYQEVANIVRLKASGRYTEIFTVQGTKYTVTRNLGEFDKLLSRYHFLRVHHSHLINPVHIKSYEKGEGGHLIMTDNGHVEVSRRHKEEILKFIKRNI